MNKLLFNSKSVYYLSLVFYFLISFGYFYHFANNLLFFQENQFLLIFSKNYLDDFLLKPGGLIEFLGKFLTQFYTNKILGSIIISTILSLPIILLFHIHRKISFSTSYSFLPGIILSGLMLIMQSHYYYFIEYNLGILLVLLFFLFTLNYQKLNKQYIPLLLFPLLYYFSGAFAFVYFSLYFLYYLFFIKKNNKIIYPLSLLLIAIFTVVFFKNVIFTLSYKQLVTFPLPILEAPLYRKITYITVAFLLIYFPITKIFTSLKNYRIKKKWLQITVPVIIFFTILYSLHQLYNQQISRVLELEKLVFEKKWHKAIDFHENNPSHNQIGQYFYNVALSETDQLCDRLFYGRQDFGVNALILPWKKEYLNWGAYFYYSVGLINEAHRWAYEEMIVYGPKPQNIKLLVKTNIINGHYQRAQKFVNLLKKSFSYRGWAKNYEKLIHDTTLINQHHDLGFKKSIMPKKNFFIDVLEPQNNIPMLIQANDKNRRAFEYAMAWLLLTKNVEAIVNNVKEMQKMGYTIIPRHIEEAILAYANSTGDKPDLGGLKISNETISRFNQYISDFKQTRQNPSTQIEIMQDKYHNTFWFYFHFK